MFAILKDKAISIAPNEIDGVVNPPDEMYYAHGYSLVVYTQPPTDDVYEPEWEQRDKTILQTWVKADHNQIDGIEALNIILGGAE